MNTDIPNSGVENEFSPIDSVKLATQISPTEWAQHIGKLLPDFQGNKEYAGTALAEFLQGVDDIYTQYHMKLPKFTPTSLLIRLTNHSNDQHTAYSNDDPHFLVMTRKFLEEYARFDPDKQYKWYHDQGEVAFVGLARDRARLAGVEEAHHQVVTQLTNIKEARTRDEFTNLPLHQYDALPSELKSLRARLQYAKRQHRLNSSRFNQITQDSLRLRIQRAMQYKRTGRPPQLIPGLDNLAIK